MIIFIGAALATVGSASFAQHGFILASLVLCVITVTGSQVVLNAFTAELFPTELRSSAFAWSNNLLGRIGMVASPALVGMLAERSGYVVALQAIAVFPLLALLFIVAMLPETRGRELEDTAKLAKGRVSASEGKP